MLYKQIDPFKMPGAMTNSKSFGMLCCTSGPVTATLKIPKQGYVCGEKMPIYVEVDNKADKKMSNVKVELNQR